MEQKLYSSKELNNMIGYIDVSGSNSSKQQLITRCANAGLKIQAIDTPRGAPNKYIIIEDDFHKEGEEWKICYCNSEWEVSNLGRIRRLSTKKLMGHTNSDDYTRVCMIGENGKTTNKQLNRLVFFTFNPDLIEYEKDIQIDHINGIRSDNRLENLRAVSAIRNSQLRDENQNRIKTLTTELILKYGYEEAENKIKQLLTNK